MKKGFLLILCSFLVLLTTGCTTSLNASLETEERAKIEKIISDKKEKIKAEVNNDDKEENVLVINRTSTIDTNAKSNESSDNKANNSNSNDTKTTTNSTTIKTDTTTNNTTNNNNSNTNNNTSTTSKTTTTAQKSCDQAEKQKYESEYLETKNKVESTKQSYIKLKDENTKALNSMGGYISAHDYSDAYMNTKDTYERKTLDNRRKLSKNQDFIEQTISTLTSKLTELEKVYEKVLKSIGC